MRGIGHSLRVALVIALGVAIFWQATFAGRFLAGHAAALKFHENGAHAVVVLGALVLLVEIALARRAHAWRLALLAGLLFAGILAQNSLGYMSAADTRFLAYHVPLGVSIAGLYVFYLTVRLRSTAGVRTPTDREASFA